jgi:hypothetical protein
MFYNPEYLVSRWYQPLLRTAPAVARKSHPSLALTMMVAAPTRYRLDYPGIQEHLR